uniref:Uncharacterized protein n=1 Tax=Anguilla anguilla TaxID=7936 RepID=A0A0E9VJS7_ANGAN
MLLVGYQRNLKQDYTCKLVLNCMGFGGSK